MILRKLHMKQSGDTIVEVLIAIAVVSLVLTAAYSSASHNTRSIQDAQEHSQALLIAQRQIEFLKADGGTSFPANNCFNSVGAAQVSSGAAGTNPCLVQASGKKVPGPNVQPAYTIAIAQTSASPSSPFAVTITWASLLNDGNSTIKMYYRP